ncbi:MAG TPA: 7-carboxy-7-deazaguanine synthase QueE [Methanothermobacter sp.]|nr:7-carboxy-7-deazaguanine synthase [Methanothermobacter sp. MT-2]HHW04657.1 7-carboxy-7-deazaguanine synthase QueE [Methanothermobacter sp.]HOK72122.1 7-carboxy-7-deazaguanine synthase QueE [Methanothermobacter sp.]HOL68435.1 7-carboxy-7-deazaguanine synthase QueE [Methanothermobacter sp.]HPQ04193.1 7-carboxy-7-deazaguanine synthase QueE [Methanothermobacter sp.]
MRAPIMEVFSSIQGEGLLVGCRQIFIRFAGCNLNCSYCDTPESRDPQRGRSTSIRELKRRIKDLESPDLHSISLTGGEPLLYADFIKNFLEETDYKSLLETNGSLPGEIKKIAPLIDYASVDIKLPEHIGTKDIIEKEIQSINILIKRSVNTYLKVVVLPTTSPSHMGLLAQKLRKEISEPSMTRIVIQPSSPIDHWVGNTPRLLKISEEIGRHFKVRLIPQVHKILDLR